MLKMLIAVDGSEPALRAVETVARLATQTQGLQAWLLNVREGPVYYGELPPFDYEAIERLQRQRRQELLDAALAHTRRCGLESVSIQAALRPRCLFACGARPSPRRRARRVAARRLRAPARRR